GARGDPDGGASAERGRGGGPRSMPGSRRCAAGSDACAASVREVSVAAWARVRPRGATRLVPGAPVVAGAAGIRAERGTDHVRGLLARRGAGRGPAPLSGGAPRGSGPRAALRRSGWL